jgi:outer membrane protein OmpA-like peptidoglycan-associated protein
VVLAEKKGYQTTLDTISITPEELELLGGKKTYNVYMKQISLDNMLPLALYFDNDRPDRRTWSTTTNTDYLPTNETYYSRKDDFIQGFTEDLSESEKYLTVRRFETFFDREVKEAATELNKFTQQIHEMLKEGRTVKMRLKGFCSPRGASKYNQMLSSRRIDCVKNHFKRYEGGVLLKYIRSGKLAFLEESYGESKADASKISDKFDDLKNSVFSLLASAERRVQIDEVIIE